MPPKKQFSPDFCPLPSIQKHVKEVDLILESVILNHLSESIILCGPSGCGKSVIVHEALLPYSTDKKLQAAHQIVHIDGATHCELGACVDAILSQLQPNKIRLRPNGSVVGTAAEKLKELTDALAGVSTRTGKKAVVFVIDQLENFVEQKNQLLLYSLFDSAREQDLPICVIGLSTVLDVLEKMEKRVKSRFSQRVMTVVGNLFADVEDFSTAVRFMLERRLPDWPENDIAAIVLEPACIALVNRLFESRKDWQAVNMLVEIIAAARDPNLVDVPEPATFYGRVSDFFFADPTQRLIRDLPHLHLTLLLCCFEFVDTQQEDTFNYVMIQELYATSTRQKTRSVKFGETFVRGAFFELVDYGLLRPTTTKPRNEPQRYHSLSLGVSKYQLRGALKESDLGSLPTDLRQWCEAHM
ncbi:putative Origin recognition complex subunit 4 [Hypsibius exemplaris]|uniref:Origin recognition complex subunit 4 n=1 Tax=Hypsibius exemplaris TaxID=2072580 RepID=A0A1W0WRN8_HYPEX|nr:putative Origin recognition complex subunit 4 [Hypsibius exemplaris]